MTYEFDKEFPRDGTHSVKWEYRIVGGEEHEVIPTDIFLGEKGVLPMWVADMDLPCPDAVVEALVARASNCIYGYTKPPKGFFDAIVGWMERRHGWSVNPEWICTTPGVVPALHMAVRSFVERGEKVLIQTPVYHPFYSAIETNDSIVVENPLIEQDGSFRMDFEDLERKARDPMVKLAILCSPHNPVGRVWSREELQKFGEICVKHNILVVSDEIHADFVFNGQVFTPYSMISEVLAQQAVICTAPSKTFNLAGLKVSGIIIPNEEIRERFQKTLKSTGLRGTNIFGIEALQAAYGHGEPWLSEVLVYIQGNFDYLQAFVTEKLSPLRLAPMEGTYLAWIDCRGLGLRSPDLGDQLMDEWNVYLEDGRIFGSAGDGFLRMNIACPRPLLRRALDRIEGFVAAHR